MAYNQPWIIRKSIEAYYATKDPRVETVHILIDQHWPIGYAKLRAELESIARDYNLVLMDPGRNLGLHKGFNWAWRQHAIPDNAGVIGYDPDCIPSTPGWDMKLCEIFCAVPEAGWLSLNNPRTQEELQGRTDLETIVAGQHIARLSHPVVNSICMFRQKWLIETQGIHESNPFYGTLETTMFPMLPPFRWYVLKDVMEGDSLRDTENLLYRQWKWDTCHTKKIPVDKDFGTWLRETHPEAL